MTMIRTRWGRLRTPVVAALAVLAAGCGTEHVGAAGGAGAPAAAVTAVPTTEADYPCPGETPTRTPTPTASSAAPTGPPVDHYAENHGFRVPIPLHGRRRCDGLDAVKRIKGALEPLRTRGDFAPDSTRGQLTGLGYQAAKVKVTQNGPTGIAFLVDATGLCLEGTMNSAVTTAEAFAGYPDGTDCEEPRGGH
ncbi:hypothetical protein ACIRST_00820 [Kitasatospora sp. NPDC101447]|uniref:hypothetical protein n=1 Tax=Kitasatospora sp. NPDC101447 TaxID=3364102 RepID=UPI0038129D81